MRHNPLHYIFQYYFTSSLVLGFQGTGHHFCANWFSNLQEIISVEERTFSIMYSLPAFLLSFYLSALRAIKHPMNCVAVPGKNDCHFPFSTTHHRLVWSCTALWLNVNLMERKHTWLLTSLQLLLCHVLWFSFYESFSPVRDCCVAHH